MRKTKIICTIGPATESFEMLEKLAEAGMNVVRLNMSHGDHESHAKVIKAVRTLNKKQSHPIAILMDTQGPEIRTGDINNELDLKKDDVISVVARGEDDVEASSIRINYEDLIHDVQIGDMITVDNGLINLEILSKEDRVMQCKVIDGGVLKSKRHVNLPGIRVNLPAITEKDKRDIEFAMEQEVDFIALWGCRVLRMAMSAAGVEETGYGEEESLEEVEDEGDEGEEVVVEAQATVDLLLDFLQIH